MTTSRVTPTLAVVVALALAACDTSPRPPVVVASIYVVEDSVVSIAAQTRATGGLVFVGRVDGARAGGFVVTDGLGDTALSHVTLLDFDRRDMTPSGDWVLFVGRDESGALHLRWRARLLPDGTVDGSGTASGASVPLSMLRTGV